MPENKVLVLGNGGREHALACCLLKSASVCHVFVCPGNAGMKTSANITIVGKHTHTSFNIAANTSLVV